LKYLVYSLSTYFGCFLMHCFEGAFDRVDTVADYMVAVTINSTNFSILESN
jgi:hypothetical protein